MTTEYSLEVKGEEYNYNWSVRFDLTSGDCLGISQVSNGKLVRVLLSKNQIEELLLFLRGKIRK